MTETGVTRWTARSVKTSEGLMMLTASDQETTATPELAEAHMRGLLGSLGLDVDYVRAEGNTMFYQDGDQEVAVLDCVGGYGSLLLGHNHPELAQRAVDLFTGAVPMHAQFSYHPYANALAGAINRAMRKELEGSEAFRAVFASTGAEAVEIALKHAELARNTRVQTVVDEVTAATEETLAAVKSGDAELTTGIRDELGVTTTDPDRLAAELEELNRERATRPPVFISLTGSFHGKLAGSVQLTHNPLVRIPFRGLAAQARFVPSDDPSALRDVVEREQEGAVGLELSDGHVRHVSREMPVVAAILVEPVQGEGGINILTREMAAEIRAVAAANSFPVVVDEIQSGMGRSGTFLASTQVGLVGDYYMLGKSLGGGLAKSSVLLVRDSMYHPEFELLHSSTFAKDAFSCHIGIAAIGLLEADDGAAYKKAAERGAALGSMLDDLARSYPEVLIAERGIGLMRGLEFRDQSTSTDPVLGEHARQGLFGYLVAGYLLRRHAVRVFPTASSPHTLRFEPSIYLTDDEISQLREGLAALCRILAAQDGAALLPG